MRQRLAVCCAVLVNLPHAKVRLLRMPIPCLLLTVGSGNASHDLQACRASNVAGQSCSVHASWPRNSTCDSAAAHLLALGVEAALELYHVTVLQLLHDLQLAVLSNTPFPSCVRTQPASPLFLRTACTAADDHDRHVPAAAARGTAQVRRARKCAAPGAAHLQVRSQQRARDNRGTGLSRLESTLKRLSCSTFFTATVSPVSAIVA